MEKLTREQVINKLNYGEKDFKDLDLSGLDLKELDFSNADLSNANLSYADLYKANLSYANLCCADLTDTNLSYADLSVADLSSANLYSAYLYNANLKNIDLRNANLYDAKLDEKEQIRKGLILEEPMFGYKRCRGGIIVTLEIPKGATVFSINNSDCRTNKAKVIDISNEEKIAYSLRDNSFTYELGKEIEIEYFNLMYNIENTSGIHFFKTREEAEEY